jgi:hypothetical protein
MDKNRLPRQALHYRPNGQRNIGRPKKTSFTWRIKEQATRLTPLFEHDDDDDDDDDDDNICFCSYIYSSFPKNMQEYCLETSKFYPV